MYKLPPAVEYHFTGLSGDNPLNFVTPYKEQSAKRRNDFVIGWITHIAPLVELPDSKHVQFISNQGQIPSRSIPRRFVKKALSRKMPFFDAMKIIFSIKKFSKKDFPVISNSVPVQEACIKTYKLSRDKCSVIPRGIDTEFFSPGERLFSSEKPKILFAGNVSPAKGIDDLIDAVLLIEMSVEIVLCGKCDEKYLESLKNAIKSSCSDHSISFPGPISQNDLLLQYRSCDLFVFPSHSEGMPKVLLEALSCGCAVACSDIPSHKEVVTHGYDALVFPVRSPEGIAFAIKKILESREKSDILRKNARETSINNFSRNHEIQSWIDILRKRRLSWHS